MFSQAKFHVTVTTLMWLFQAMGLKMLVQLNLFSEFLGALLTGEAMAMLNFHKGKKITVHRGTAKDQ